MLELTTEDFRKRIANAVASVNIAQYSTDMQQVQHDYLLPAFGEEFYMDLSSKYKEGTATALQLQLVEILLDAIAPLAQAAYLPLQPLQISDRGAHIVSSADEKTPFEHQVKAAVATYTHKGFQAIERALRFLEKQIDHVDFTLWATSDACTFFKQHTLADASEFDHYYSIGNSRRTYKALVPVIRKTEDFHLAATLGAEFFDELKEQLKDRDITAENGFLLRALIRPAMAHLTIAAALETGGFNMNGEALELAVDSTSDGLAGPMLQSKINNARKDGNTYLAKLKTYLNVNAAADKYATYYNSSAYTAPGTATSFNSDSSKVYSFI